MSRELYFLRSSEQKIVIDMFKYAHPKDSTELAKYTEFFGFTNKDLGLYALVDNEIAGAIWTRRLNADHKAKGFIDEDTPVLSIAVIPKFRGKQIGKFMMGQFLQEAGALYEQISVSTVVGSTAVSFYEKFGFEMYNNSIMLKQLERKEVVRPTDGYDPTKWMD